MALRFASTPFFRLLANNGKAIQSRGMSRNPYSDPRGFTFASMKKNPAVLPLVAIIGAAVSGVIGYSTYAAFTRPDVSLNKKVFEWDTMDVMNPKKLKMRVYNKDNYEAKPELKEALSYRDEYTKKEQPH